MRRWLSELSLAMSMFAASTLAAKADIDEAVRFRSASVQPTPLRMRLAAERGETAAAFTGDEIGGSLYRPAMPGKRPALVVLHGCGGPSSVSTRADSAAWFLSLGYVALFVDSFGPRGIKQECSGDTGSADRTMDALGALDYLASLPFVRRDRIAVVGESQGGGAAISAVDADAPQLPSNNHFAAAVAFYPAGGRPDVTVPTLILVGEWDDWTPASEQRALLARHGQQTPEMRLIVYPGAYHNFNVRGLSGKPRIYFGHRLEYNEAADVAARLEVAAFLSKYLDD